MMKKLNRFAALLLVFLLLTPAALGDGVINADMPACYRYISAGNAVVSVAANVNVYVQPSATSNIAGQVKYAENVEVLVVDTRQGWAFIRSDSVPKGGWIQSAMLTMEKWLSYNGTLISSGEGRRINLRATPSANAEVLAKYYGGTLVEILDYNYIWEGQVSYAYVSVDGAEGYVDTRRLQEGVSSNRVQMPAIMVHSNASSQSPLYATPYMSNEIVTYVTNASYVTVLGIRPNGMYHVMYQGQSGYIRQDALREVLPWDLNQVDVETGATEQIYLDASYDSLYVLSSKKGSRVNLRNKPDSGAVMLVQYYTGTPVTVIGEPVNGFQYIRIGRVEGYMMEEFLVDTPYERESDLKLYEIVTDVGYGTVQKWNSDTSEVVDVLYNGTKVVVVGRDGKWAHVVYDEKEQNYGFMLFEELVEVEK